MLKIGPEKCARIVAVRLYTTAVRYYGQWEQQAGQTGDFCFYSSKKHPFTILFVVFLSWPSLSPYITMTAPASSFNEPRGKAFANLFFTRAQSSDEKWKYNTCDAVVVQRSCYTNLCNHICAHHPHIIERKLEASRKRHRKVFDTMTQERKVCSVHSKIKCFLMPLLPFSVVKSSIFKKCFKLKSVSWNTLLSYMQSLTTLVDAKITNILPSKFASIFDGWTGSWTH